MSTIAQSAIADLSAQERLSLIALLWDSLSDDQTPLPETQRAELERRIASFDVDRFGAASWKSLKIELRSHSNLSARGEG